MPPLSPWTPTRGPSLSWPSSWACGSPLYCTAMGKAILSHYSDKDLENYLETTEFYRFTQNTITDKESLVKEIEEIKKKGYTLNREEHFLARASIGAPIFGPDKKVVAATCIVGQPKRILGSEKEKLAQMITTMAVEVSQAMGYFPTP